MSEQQKTRVKHYDGICGQCGLPLSYPAVMSGHHRPTSD